MRTSTGRPAYPSRPQQVITLTGALAVLLLVFIGCASVPKPVTIRHTGAQSLNDAAKAPPPSRTGAVDPGKQPNANPQSAPAAPEKQQTAGLPATAPAETEAKPATNGPGTALAAAPSAEAAGMAAARPAYDQDLVDRITARVTEDVRSKIGQEVTYEIMTEIYRALGTADKRLEQALKEREQRFRFGGDIRVRYEQDRFDKNNYNEFTSIVQGTDTQQLMNTWADQTYFKYRVRFGAEARVNEQTDAVIRLSTGSTSNPVSTNATMGDYQNKDSVVFDLAYIRWQPAKSLTLFAGRMPNPFYSSTDLIWDNDLNFEGLAARAKQPVGEPWSAFLTAGAFPLQQSASIYDFSQHSKWIYGGQAGFERTDKKGISAKAGVAYYYFSNIVGVRNEVFGQPGATDWSAPLYNQKGNAYFFIDEINNSLKVGLASDFKEVHLNGNIDIGFWDPVHIVLLGDYVKNIGFKKADVIARTGNPDQPVEITGYQAGISVGYPVIQDKGQWRVILQAKRLGADAVLDAYADSDFHLGGTNARGWILGVDTGIGRNQWLTFKWLTANEISGPPLAIDVLQADFNVRF